LIVVADSCSGFCVVDTPQALSARAVANMAVIARATPGRRGEVIAVP
jgi:hypothetical protein